MDDLLKIGRFLVDVGGPGLLIGGLAAWLANRRAEKAEARVEVLSDKLIKSGEEATARMQQLAFQGAAAQQELVRTVKAVKAEIQPDSEVRP